LVFVGLGLDMNGLDSFVITSIASNIASMEDNQLRLLAKILSNNPNGDRLSYLINVEIFDAAFTEKYRIDIEVQDSVC
jgi:hypothetical protein